jgi:pimeloyl-ACP methyl ester carboxylesterase
MRNIVKACLLVLVSTGVSLAAQSSAAFQRPAAPGQLVDIGGGRRLHIFCKGTGEGPTVVIEAGLSQYTATSTYGKAQDAIAPFARVCVYDRAGLGWSDPAPADRTHVDMVSDLHKLLIAAKIPAPYIMVGHSLGGLLVRQYAQMYRSEVAGVVLADATSESNLFDDEGARFRAGVVAQIAQGLAKAKPGEPVVPLPDGTSTDIVMSFMPEVLAAVKDEYLAIDRTPAEMRAPLGYGTLGALPLVVIRRGKTATPPSASDIAWQADQERLTTLSTSSSLVVAENAGHVIPYDAPGVVADAVRRVLAACRR